MCNVSCLYGELPWNGIVTGIDPFVLYDMHQNYIYPLFVTFSPINWLDNKYATFTHGLNALSCGRQPDCILPLGSCV